MPLRTFETIRARLDFKLLPPLNSLILFKMNGVLSLPVIFASFAWLIASAIIMSISDLGIAASSGIGFAKCSPDVRGKLFCASIEDSSQQGQLSKGM